MTFLNLFVGGICIAIFFFIMGTKYADMNWLLASQDGYPVKYKKQVYFILTELRMAQLEATEKSFNEKHLQYVKENLNNRQLQ